MRKTSKFSQVATDMHVLNWNLKLFSSFQYLEHAEITGTEVGA